ncbi:MAG: type II secretion system F family protein [bacterium]
MPRYSYIAKSLKGEDKTGEAEAKDVHQLARILKAEDFILIKADLKEEKKKESLLRIFKGGIPFFGGVPVAEKMMFTRNLQVMISSGLPLPRALETLSLQTKNKRFQKAISEIKEQILKGKSFSDCLKGYPDIFSELFQSMIKVGEESGTMDQSLKVLTRQIEREHELKTKIKGALVYPAVVISAMIGIAVLMLIMVVPKLAETFEELEIELPLTTKIVIGLGVFLAERWYLAILIVIVLAFILPFILRLKKGKRAMDFLVLRLPIFSPLIKKTNSAYTARTLSSLIAAGVPIVKALDITSNTLDNVYFKEAIREAMKKVNKGEKLSEALQPYQNIYPLIIFQMLKVGEETGETSGILGKLADFFEEEVINATTNMATVIEPFLMLIIGAAIGFFAISMVQPMYSMLGAV